MMGRSSGPGYPLNFRCPTLARIWPRSDWNYQQHVTVPTGKVRPAPVNGKGHPRKSRLAFQYQCTCGRTGWSTHRDLEHQAIHLELIAADDPRLARFR